MTNDITFCNNPEAVYKPCATCLRNQSINKPVKEYISVCDFYHNNECNYYLGRNYVLNTKNNQ